MTLIEGLLATLDALHCLRAAGGRPLDTHPIERRDQVVGAVRRREPTTDARQCAHVPERRAVAGSAHHTVATAGRRVPLAEALVGPSRRIGAVEAVGLVPVLRPVGLLQPLPEERPRCKMTYILPSDRTASKLTGEENADCLSVARRLAMTG